MSFTSSSSAVSSVPLIQHYQPSFCNKKRMKNSLIASKALVLSLLVEKDLVSVFPFKFQIMTENLQCLLFGPGKTHIWHKMCWCKFVVSRDRDQILHCLYLGQHLFFWFEANWMSSNWLGWSCYRKGDPSTCNAGFEEKNPNINNMKPVGDV